MPAYKHTSRIASLVLPALLTFAAASAGQEAAKPLVIDNVTVVDVRNGSLIPDQAIVVTDGRITSIVAAGSVVDDGKAQRVDGAKAFVVPGFNDMHVHNLNTFSPETSLPLMIANGITGVRQMAPKAESMMPATAEGKAAMAANTPDILAQSGTIMAGPAVATPETAKAEVARQKQEGVDFIKETDLPNDAFLAATAEAEALGLQITGHIPGSVDPRQAVAAGFDSIEHMGNSIGLLLSCSTQEEQLRNAIRAIPPSGEHVDFGQDMAALMRLLANPTLLNPPQALLMMQKVTATYSEDKCKKLAADFAASPVWVSPTLTRLEAMNLGNSSDLRNNPDLRFVPKSSRELWFSIGDEFQNKFSPEQQQILAGVYAKELAMVKLFDEAGVKMIAGTDFGGQWMAPGFSLHREFDLLAGAGVPPLHILQMTTINAAKYLGREADMGTVEAGKRANLVLLSANPLESVANLHGVSAVVKDGRYLPRTEIDAIISGAEAQLK